MCPGLPVLYVKKLSETQRLSEVEECENMAGTRQNTALMVAWSPIASCYFPNPGDLILDTRECWWNASVLPYIYRSFTPSHSCGFMVVLLNL